MSITTWISVVGAAQSAIFAVSLQHKASAWSIKMFSANFWCIIYSGISSGVLIVLQFWCMKKKGPVFVAIFNPLQTVMVVFIAYSFLGEKLYTGSIVGGVIVIIGLYVFLWGKEIDQSHTNSAQDQSSSHSDLIMAAKKEDVAPLLEKEP
ncbi:Drug/metabolite transporter [Corchorus olitorius]|uniref:WAT1-related protein n=1 Tax=Corchorus olitorius TaxID=93759 RepID=A0A1R3KQK1_9ROSI|nr:Drug/metabolite transporter [Corchorus olitorius]